MILPSAKYDCLVCLMTFSSVAMLLRKNPKPFAIFAVSVVVPSSEFIACDAELLSPPLVGNIYVLVKYF